MTAERGMFSNVEQNIFRFGCCLLDSLLYISPCVEGYILTIAASPNPAVADNSFELEKIHESLDWLNLMTYDYSGNWDNYTGIDAPLYGRYQVSCH